MDGSMFELVSGAARTLQGLVRSFYNGALCPHFPKTNLGGIKEQKAHIHTHTCTYTNV